MIILADSREKQPYDFNRWPVEIQEAGLKTGDYSIFGFEDKISIERKSLNDLIGCLKGKDRERFEKELARARSYELFAVIIEADLSDVANGLYQSQMKPTAAIQSITAFHVRYGVPFLFCGNRAGGEYLTFSLLSKYVYEIHKRYEQLQKHNEEVTG